MLSNRTKTRTAWAVAAAVVPISAVLTGASTATESHYAGPAPTDVAQVSQLSESVADPAPAKTDVAEPAEAAAPAPKLPESVLSGTIPKVNFEAYKAAQDTMAKSAAACHIDWTLIAGIGRVESHHANLGDADDNGQLRSPIYGPTLDGSLAGNQVIGDTDGGALDGDTGFDRAVGPMQFLPSTWKTFAADGNGDGKIDPQNVFDAALTTARYLCHDGLDLSNEGDRVAAVLRYNNSSAYVSEVLGYAASY
ncbi:lytic murein transglycosylase [Gordonia sp. (in: high G+C Gram-positive bacteria)]|uniref:lytic transglycosylase domain-containing protein n=1 Tax=Gordonia sp. (in: high G+C Gram-positive bacteria) TaxID=84139 RepID=UPI0016B05D69|nr:lytic murein transglycosylase [Gordonia sp. (in: high G+C Gram-positive bacteria)]NLG48365.1 murein transglycosylase [Gordonia sp. (in: high G+C Gram-positive bacteria)]